MSAIFISHSSHDNGAAGALRAALDRAGYRSVFLDFHPEDGILPGRNWEAELYANLRSCQAVVVLCSEHSMSSKWCFAEITHAKALGKEVFPVRIGQCSIEPILTSYQVLDLTAGSGQTYDDLVSGFVAANLDPISTLGLRAGRSPYPGLLAFEEDDAAVFFGRDAEVQEGLDLLNQMRRFSGARSLVLLGASGSGKSSVLKAGMLPRLRLKQNDWLIVEPFRPRSRPFQEMAIALAASFKRYEESPDWRRLRDDLERQANTVLADCLLDLRVAARADSATVLLIIDQAEELLQGSAETFFRAIAVALANTDVPTVAVFTVRSDFFEAFQHLAATVNLGLRPAPIGPMPMERLPRIIEGPAERAAIQVEPNLTRQIVEDAGTHSLPLVAFALRELYEVRSAPTRPLALQDYRNHLGGLEGSIARAAEAVFTATAPSKQQLAEIRQAFLRMVSLNEQNQFTRAPLPTRDIPASIQPILERFVQARLLVACGDDGAEPTIEIAHEALLRAWSRLHDWLGESRADLARLEGLRRAARDWNRQTRLPELVLHRGGRLEDIEALLQQSDTDFDLTERAYIEACRAERDAIREAERRMADTARVAIASDWLTRDPTTTALVLLEMEKPDHTLFALSRMAEVLSYPLARCVLRGHRGGVRAAVFSPDGARIATASDDHSARVWTADGDTVAVLAGHGGIVRTIAFGPDGTRLVTASDDGTARVWSCDGREMPLVLEGHKDGLLGASFDLTGTQIATASRDGTARVWQLGGSAPVVLTGHEGMVTVAMFSQMGDRVLTAGVDGTVRVWTIGSAKPPLVFQHDSAVLTAAFSPDGGQFATGTITGVATVWSLDQTIEPVLLRGHSGSIFTVAFSPDGTSIVTGSGDNLAVVWRFDGSDPVVLQGHSGPVLKASFSADGGRVLTASEDGMALVSWPDASRTPLRLRGHAKALNRAMFSPNGDRVATASSDGTARLWNITDLGEPRVLGEYVGAVTCVAFADDGMQVATATNVGSLYVWDVDGTEAPMISEGLGGNVRALRLCPQGWVAVSVADGVELASDLIVWSAGRAVRLSGHTKRIHHVAIDASGTRVVTSSNDGTVRIWGVDGITPAVIIPEFANGVWFNPDGSSIATFSGGTFQLWSLDGTRMLLQVEGYKGTVKTIRFSETGSVVVTGDDEGSIFVWPPGRADSPTVLQGHSKFVVCAEFNQDGSRIATASWDNTVRVWATCGDDEPLVLHGHQEQINCLAFNPVGDRLVSGACDRTARVWPLSAARLQAAIRSRTAAVLDPEFRTQFLGDSRGGAAHTQSRVKN